MTVEIRDGWLHGSLQDDTGRVWPIERFPQASARGALSRVPDLCLHTTETDGYIKELRYPSQFQVGAGQIGQHIRLGLAGDAVNTHDGALMGIEIVGRSKLTRWLPGESALGPLVALVAWLHRTGRIRTGLARPSRLASLSITLDRGPQATSSYYRRMVPSEPGVYGHVDIADNSHWDPGSWDYPVFFERVRRAIAVQEGRQEEEDVALTDAQTEDLKAAGALARGVEDFLQGTEPPAGADPARKQIFRALKVAASRPVPSNKVPEHTHPVADHTHPPVDQVQHTHTFDIGRTGPAETGA